MLSHSGGSQLNLVVSGCSCLAKLGFCRKIPHLVVLGFAGERQKFMEMGWRVGHGAAGGSWRKWGEERKIGIFFTVLGFHWVLLEKGGRNSFLGLISSKEFLPCSPDWGWKHFQVENPEENPVDAEETHRREGNLAGMGFVYGEKGKFGMRGGTSHLSDVI